MDAETNMEKEDKKARKEKESGQRKAEEKEYIE